MKTNWWAPMISPSWEMKWASSMSRMILVASTWIQITSSTSNFHFRPWATSQRMRSWSSDVCLSLRVASYGPSTNSMKITNCSTNSVSTMYSTKTNRNTVITSRIISKDWGQFKTTHERAWMNKMRSTSYKTQREIIITTTVRLRKSVPRMKMVWTHLFSCIQNLDCSTTKLPLIMISRYQPWKEAKKWQSWRSFQVKITLKRWLRSSWTKRLTMKIMSIWSQQCGWSSETRSHRTPFLNITKVKVWPTPLP